MSTRIPSLLEPYLSLPPEASLVLLTNVLSASSNWVVLRFLYSALAQQDGGSTAANEQNKVVLISFLRDFGFWKEGARRLGIDLEKLGSQGRFVFVDGLSGLFQPQGRTGVLEKGKGTVLASTDPQALLKDIERAIQQLRSSSSQNEGKILLVIDQLDLLLAAGGDAITPASLGDLLMSLREQVHATVLTLSADEPLVSAQQTPLETSHSAFLLSIAHQADYIMSLRLLDTGTARDVSGVIRITIGDQAVNDDRDIETRIEERELLYFVGGDGGVKVFERGQ
ncbi:hypothetical protein F5884DRAFT_903322 [Xylogone sp. PMI_703]|nr:hypothetical protein F5884DRAFT_903322 [Xylogone sp. PMI_703]